ncbi:MAG: diguanylate cyclase [Anaerolineales bacterium]|nr:diguanylate cyclase [Anaerolineales bacterium]
MQKLKDSELRYRRLFEAAQDGILILDATTGMIEDVNPYLIKMLGYSREEFVKKKLWEVGAFKDIKASQDAFEALQDNEYIRYEDLPLKSKDGKMVEVEFVSNVYFAGGEKVIQCDIRDITDRRLAETRAQLANNELLLLVDELQSRDREMQLLNQMNDLLQSCMTHAEAYQVITQTAVELFPGLNGFFAILNDSDQQLKVVVHWGAEVLLMEPALLSGDCWALRRGQLHKVVNPETDLLCNHFSHPPQAGYLCLPLMVQGKALGVFCLVSSATQTDRQKVSRQQLAISVSESIKLSLSHLKLREELRYQVFHDLLTGLFNRRYLDETLPRELHMAQRRKTPLCVVMLDVDGFKLFNDSFGHAAGDEILRDFGNLLRERLRKSDISCRYGGDEFILILPDSSIADTQERVEQIRIFLKGLQQIHYGEETAVRITLSAGIACMPEHGMTENELLKAADEALYSAKNDGRDRIVVYQMKTS